MVALFTVRHIDFVVASRKFLSCGVRRMTDEKLVDQLVDCWVSCSLGAIFTAFH